MTALFGTFMAVLSGIMTPDISQVRIGLLGEIIGFAMMGLAVLFWLGRRRPWAAWSLWSKASSNELVITQLYRRMRTYLGGQGLSKSAAIAPLELVRITQGQWNEAHAAVASITELYCRTRFGRIPLTPEDMKHAEDQLRGLLELRKPPC